MPERRCDVHRFLDGGGSGAEQEIRQKSCSNRAAAVVTPFSVTRTDWAALVKPKAGVKRPKSSPAALLPFSGAPQSPANAREEAPPAKLKPKTQGVPTGETDVKIERFGRKDDVPAVRPTPVSSRVHKVFSTLFTAAKDKQVAVQNGSVAWKDIQTAFAHLDFTLLKTCGSTWTFRHPNDRRTVTVHEPHPEPTMRFWEARRFRRRLTMASFMLNPKMA
ncbi:hypothetical protein DFH09DRAFT_1491686 [Mycena vulgaris]|nr:hypothetical protein DFH09DRAFT_1491686 [Mycena vulgaris]